MSAYSFDAASVTSPTRPVRGDAKAADNAKIAACNVTVGMLVNSVYGVRRVLKVNAKSVLIEGSYGDIKIGKELIWAVRQA